MLRRGVGAVLAILAWLVTGCDEACTLETRASVLVEVVDVEGRPVPRANVRATRDGERVQVTCPRRDENSLCDQWWVGMDRTGIYVVTAEAPGGDTGTDIAFVGATEDGCQVETEQLRIVVE